MKEMTFLSGKMSDNIFGATEEEQLASTRDKLNKKYLMQRDYFDKIPDLSLLITSNFVDFWPQTRRNESLQCGVLKENSVFTLIKMNDLSPDFLRV